MSKEITGEDIVERLTLDNELYANVRKLVNSAEWCTATNNNIVEHINEKKFSEFNDVQGANLHAYMSLLQHELRLNLWTSIASINTGDKNNCELGPSLNKYCCQLILDAFGVKAGLEGVGMVPKIPDWCEKYTK